ncbi:MAG: ion transporter [Crocinitomicaceae bacterium]|jgi:voltage-gated potassium channel|nr:ion transporter [Crocinitomicaceae bacterium]MBT6515355.1 ion transporter [Crocinitomicaceae bacterium]
MKEIEEKKALKSWQLKLHEVIYEADTPAGKLFDVALLIAILLSVFSVMLESVESIGAKYQLELLLAEWVFTIIFSIEYILRIIAVRKPLKYILSFYGVVDLLSIVPTYLGLFITNASFLRAIRTIRLLRVFRIFKIARYIKEANVLVEALKATKARIFVFLFGVVVMVTIMGTVMYIIEDYDGTKFTSIPRSIYWAIVTLTTVGYGDISPQTEIGQFLSSIIMIMGYAIIAVPTGIVSVELAKKGSATISTQACASCSQEGHDYDAKHCKFCGEILNP